MAYLDLDEEVNCCNDGLSGFLRRNWFNFVCIVCCGVLVAVAAAVDNEPAVYILAAATGALPAARVVLWIVKLVLRLVLADVLLWYAGAVLRHAVVCTWAAVVLATVIKRPVRNDRAELALTSACYVLIGVCVVRSVAHVGLQTLHHMVALAHHPTKFAMTKRALMVLGHLHVRVTGEGAGRQSGFFGPTTRASGQGAAAASGAAPRRTPSNHVQLSNVVAGDADGGVIAAGGLDAPLLAAGDRAGVFTADPARPQPAAGAGASAGAGAAAASGGRSRGESLGPVLTASGKRDLRPVEESPRLLDNFLGILEDSDKFNAAIDALFDSMRSPRRGELVVTATSLQSVLAPADASLLIAQLGLFRTAFTRDDLKLSVRALHGQFNRGVGGNRSAANHTWILRIAIDVLLFCAAPVVFLLLLHVDPVSVLVPLGSGLVAASFVFAPTVQSFVVSLVFVLIQHPFDIGDIIVVDTNPYRVDSIALMHTCLISTVTKARVYMPNVKLAQSAIENGQRSNHAVVGVEAYVDPWLTAAQVKEIHKRMRHYMREESTESWLQPAEPYVIAGDIRADDGKVNIKVYGSTWVAWNARGAVFMVKSGLTLALTAALKEMGISHEKVPTRLLMPKHQERRQEEEGSAGLT